MLTVFYDGTCGMCHRAVQFLLRRDRTGQKFRYAPLQGETAQSILGTIEELPDSMVVQDEQGKLHVQGDATRTICRALGGIWLLPAVLLGMTPRPLRNWMYDLVAARRYRWFGKKEEACPLLLPEERERFLP
ncbi:MAG: thiol-disulfide oxidoreductase DCC family protein [Myxococcota bacterium]